ncbi:MAG: hypothetical protein ILA11_10875 [Butyrivibrio sp.]|nr:hypothetical protein [Butyrivibrio sp.]
MANEEMKNNVNEEVKVEETKTDEVEELKKLLAEAKGLLEANKQGSTPEKKEEEGSGFMWTIHHRSFVDCCKLGAKKAGKILLGAGIIGGAALGGKYLYDSHKPKQIPGETYVSSEVVDD